MAPAVDAANSENYATKERKLRYLHSLIYGFSLIREKIHQHGLAISVVPVLRTGERRERVKKLLGNF